jgi:hypothetical protein
MLSVIIGTLGWFGFDAGDSVGGRQTEAKVVTGRACNEPGTEVVTFQQDGRERRADFDGCGHQEGETVQIRVPSPTAPLVHSADATPGEADPGRGLALLLLTLASIAGGAYALLWTPDLRTRLGPLSPIRRR